MIGAIIGDIVGSRFKSKNHFSTDFELFTSDCTFTADTVCTIAVADALLKDLLFEESLRHWCHKYPNQIDAYSKTNPKQCDIFNNGSAVQVSPCAWFSDNRETVLTMAHELAERKHNHHEGIREAMCVADCIYHFRFGGGKHLITALLTRYSYHYIPCDEIRRTKTFNETYQNNVQQAISCFLESSDFESAIRLAVSIGGDSNTIAAITGSIAEAFYGVPEHLKLDVLGYIPDEFINVLSDFNNKKANIIKDYSMYRFFKGEKKNPFTTILKAHEIDNSHLPPPKCLRSKYTLPIDEVKKLKVAHVFWSYERHFEEKFIQNECSDWYTLFDSHGIGDAFMKILSEEDDNCPKEKKKAAIFNLWINDYFFVYKVYSEYGNENKDKKIYYSTSCPITSKSI